MSKPTFDLTKKYLCPPFWLYTLLKQGLFGLRSLQTRYPLADDEIFTDRQPVFVLGAGRSGTTLLRSMLTASRQIAIPVEMHVLYTLPVKFRAYQGMGWEDISRLMIAEMESHHFFHLWEINLTDTYQKIVTLPENERSLARIIDEVYMSYAAQKFPDAKTWGDQSPINTFFWPYIHRVFPQAKYIHMLRDGRDVIASWLKLHGEDFLTEATYRWKTSIQRAIALKKAVGSNQYLEIRYEDLVQHSEEKLSQICNFINIVFTPEMLDYYKLPSTIEHKHHFYHQNLSKPVFTSSIGKWREQLTEDQQHYVLKNITNELMQSGYIV